MDTILQRYRSITVLLGVIMAQLLLIAYQVKSNQDVRLIRVWAMTAVTPLARLIETSRGTASRFLSDYFVLLDVREQNKSLKAELDRMKLENQFLKTELTTADRARALAAFQTRSQSRTVAARIIGNAPGATSKVWLLDRGSSSGIERGMAVITPDGIVGKIISVYQFASLMLLVNDSTFAAGVMSQKSRVHGTLKGQGHSTCLIDYIQNEQQVEPGEMFYTSGDDRVFPKGVPVGQASVVRQGKTFKEIYVVPSGLQNSPEEVLIVVEGVHQPIPDATAQNAAIKLLPAPPAEPGAAPGPAPMPVPTPVGNAPAALSTDADQMLDRYKRIGKSQGVKYGENSGKLPNFNQPPEPRAADEKNAADKTAGPVSKPDQKRTEEKKTGGSKDEKKAEQKNPGGAP